MSTTDLKASRSKKDVAEAQEYYDKAIELLKKQKPREAVPLLQAALKMNPDHQDAQITYQNTMESFKWNVAYFCPNCGNFVKPKGRFPFSLDIDEFCLKCGSFVPTKREKLIAFAEIAVKILTFGPFPILILFFVAMPNFVVDPKTMWVGFQYRAISEGFIRSLSFTPVILLILIIIDPARGGINILYQGISYIEGLIGPLRDIHVALYFISGLLVVYASLYIYFFLLFTPIFALREKDHWKQWRHQRLVLLCAASIVLIVAAGRIYSGYFGQNP